MLWGYDLGKVTVKFTKKDPNDFAHGRALAMIDEIKELIPKDERDYNDSPEVQTWYFEEEHVPLLIELQKKHFGGEE